MIIAIGKFLFKYRNAMAPLLFLLVALDPTPIFGDPRARRIVVAVGLVLVVAGQTLRALTIGLAYIKRGGKNKEVYADHLVTTGIFAHCRNPLYVGNILMVSGISLVADSRLSVLFAIPVVIFSLVCIIAAEENYLRGRFGEEFASYCQRVPRFIPRLSGLRGTLRGMTFNWQRVLVKDYQTIYAGAAGSIILVLEDSILRHGFAASRPLLWLLVPAWALLSLAILAVRILKKTGRLRAEPA
ncbi:MAG: isoprenylcysteine carboxylmethyltransferase family protein [Verrucomicrobiota bacterium]